MQHLTRATSGSSVTKNIAKRVALITGGSSGIGEGTVRKLASRGAFVVVGDTAFEAGQKLEKELPNVTFIKTDVTQAEQLQGLVEETKKKFGRIDFLFNNAGTEGELPRPHFQQCVPSLQKVIATNFLHPIVATHYVLPIMSEQEEGGIIVNTSDSCLAREKGASSVVYGSSKAGVDSFTRYVALPALRLGVKVFSINPIAVDTPMLERVAHETHISREQFGEKYNPTHHVGTTEGVAKVVVALFDGTSLYEAGDNIVVDDVGLTWNTAQLNGLPKVVDACDHRGARFTGFHGWRREYHRPLEKVVPVVPDLSKAAKMWNFSKRLSTILPKSVPLPLH